MSQIKWVAPDPAKPTPRHVLQMFVLDRHDQLLLMHRSNNVRSARNVWSIPTGEHDIGETVAECMSRELQEEYKLDAQLFQLLDQYENIAGDSDSEEQFHWVLSLYLVLVEDLSKAVNREPDKHDKMLFADFRDIGTESFLDQFRFHDSLHNRLITSRFVYVDHMENFLHPLGTEVDTSC